MKAFLVGILTILPLISEVEQPPDFDFIIRGGTIYDGTGSPGYVADVAISKDTIALIGDLATSKGKIEIDARGLAVTPGFINMLSWADGTLLKDGSSMSDILQGVTLEVFGEGWSPGPVKRKGLTKPVDSLWTTLGGYFDFLMKKKVSPNVASFVGATSVRIMELGQENRAPTALELERMRNHVRIAMEEGAMGLGTSLIYAPADYAKTEELIALSQVASSYGGMYITHMRSEGDFILQAVNETFRIAKEANIHAEIYHMKINQARNWPKIDTLLAKIDSANRAGLTITANNYPYIASATSLTARLPTWVQADGAAAMRKRLTTKSTRDKVLYQLKMGIPSKNSDPADVQLLGFRLDSLNKLYKGKRLNEIARLHGKDADETMIDLIVRDRSPISAIYYLQSEANVKRIIAQPYVSFGSDGGSMSDSKVFDNWDTHPRVYGTFARFLGKYVRDEGLMSWEEGIRRLTGLPAQNLKLQRRGLLKPGYYADLTIFDKDKIIDKATFEKPRQYSEGMKHVWVNGVHVVRDGIHTGARPGRIIRGPGYKPKKKI